MSAQKDPKTGKWYIQYRYTDWTGKRKHSVKRGFITKREAENWLNSFQNRKACVIRRKYREYPPELVQDIRKLDRYVKLKEFCRKNRLDTPQQVESMKKEIRRQISVIAERREECRNNAKYWERHNVPVYVNFWKLAAKEKTDQMKPLYQELRMCDELMKTGPLARANSIALIQQRVREEERRRFRKELEKTRSAQSHTR